MTIERLNVILKERLENPALFKRDAYMYFDEVLPFVVLPVEMPVEEKMPDVEILPPIISPKLFKKKK